MGNWKAVLLQVTDAVDDHFDRLKSRLEQRLKDEPVCIVPYIGHGTRQRLYLSGRVMKDKGITSARDNDTIWSNLLNMYRRIESDEIPHARVRAHFGDKTREVVADEEGFFEVAITPETPLPDDQIDFEIVLELVSYPHSDNPVAVVKAIGKVIVPSATAEYGVISDLDDTVIQTDMLHLIRLARNTFLQNARTRLPFEGVAAFYQALQLGMNNTYNPFFYVSSSPWNLYDLLVDFFEVRGIPLGVFFLRNLGSDKNQLFKSSHAAHKLSVIHSLLELHPQLSFILIGDSGQHDPEIYFEVVKNYPERIKAVYIRDVAKNEEREREVMRLVHQAEQLGVAMLFVPDTVRAAYHAVIKRFIPVSCLVDIRIARTEDDQPPESLEKLLDPRTELGDL